MFYYVLYTFFQLAEVAHIVVSTRAREGHCRCANTLATIQTRC